MMLTGKRWFGAVRVAGGAAVAVTAVAAFAPGTAAHAARAQGTLSLLSINVAGKQNVAANEVLEATFSTAVEPSSVNPATVLVRKQNATQSGYTKQIFGSFQVTGNVIRFLPRLPGHLRDANGDFYIVGTPNDDAYANAGLSASSNYELTLIGRPNPTCIQSVNGRPLRRSKSAKFSTASAVNPAQLYTARTFIDSPPPQFAFSNPPDTVPSYATQYATRGGTQGVPPDVAVQMYCSRVPLSPLTVRIADSIVMTMLERYGNPALKRPVRTSVFVEQNFGTTLMVVKPQFPLADRGLFSVRVSKAVKDLTEQYDFQSNRDRDRLRQIYEFLSTERSNFPTLPASQLKDPPQSLVGDWPPIEDTAARGVLKTNVLALGDAHPEEMDPRNMVIFSTRDEPVSDAIFRVDFLKSENLFDGYLSTGEWDQTVPGAACAIFTASGGSAKDGDFSPSGNTTLPNPSLPGPEFNFRNVVIPAGVTVTFTGTVPVVLKAITFSLNGTIDISGKVGANGAPGATSAVAGGAGGPGGGAGATSSGTAQPPSYYETSTMRYAPSGFAGVDTAGGNPTTVGGQGGQGGGTSTGTAYHQGGGGGGGGAAQPGADGTKSSYSTSYPQWDGLGGKGGAKASVLDLNPLFGGAGGGAGGLGGYTSPQTAWYTGSGPSPGWGGGGGGGGGAIVVQVAKAITFGTTGQIRSLGGNGGNGSSVYSIGDCGAGGAGSGGSILLRSTTGFSIPNPASQLVVTGGTGGAKSNYGGAGGNGANGFLRAEDPFGGTSITLPGMGTTSSIGSYDPQGGGVPSFVYSKWADLGVDDPRILQWTNADIRTDPNQDDAIYVMAQMTRESKTTFGTPDLTKINANQDSTDVNTTSAWQPIKIHDMTASGQAFSVPGYNPGSDGNEYSGFSVAPFNGKAFRFIRFRIYFQLDPLQRFQDRLPNVDYILTHYQFNL